MGTPSSHREFLTPAALEGIRTLGKHIRIARKRRSLTQQDLADRASVGVATVQRLERGESVSLDILANILVAMDLEDTLSSVANPDEDETGKALEYRRLPKRVREQRKHGLDTDF
ncbi:helix-turn-helix domain-containing protein [Marinobacter sp. MBR-105]|jgi:transcriptional regulator with XRE-family HTH domain